LIPAIEALRRPRLAAGTIDRLVTMGGSRVLAAGLGFVATLMIARALEPAAMGIWSMALALQGVALHLGEAGLRSVATTEVARQPQNAQAVLRRAIGLRLSISTGIVAAASLAAALFGIGDWWLTSLLLTALWPIALQLDWLPMALGRNRIAACLLLARPVAFVLLLLLVKWDGDTTRLALLLLAAWWLAAAVSWPGLRLVSGATRKGAAAPGRRALLRLSLPVAASTVASQLLIGLDVLLVGARFGPAEAAFYHLASAVLVAGLVVANGIGQSALARMGACASRAEAFSAAVTADLRLVLGTAAIGALAILVVAPLLLPWAFGPAYVPVVGLVVWLLPWFVLQHATTVLQAALTAARRGDRLLLANGWMLAALVPGLALAWAIGDLRAFALARGLAESVRVVALLPRLGVARRTFAVLPRG
jgi:O-antigen/teichoic acid export membrane protein